MTKQSESQIQKNVISYLSTIRRKYNFVYMAPINEGVMMVLKMFRIDDEKCARIINYLKSMGFMKGASDIQIFWNSRAYFIELKLPGKDQSEHQVLFMDNVLKAGCEYAVCRSVDDVKWCLKEWGIIK
jgi:hypothetical protein